MTGRHNGPSRLARRTAEEVRASARIGRDAGPAEGVNAFRAKVDLQVMNLNGYREPPAVRRRLVRKHEAVMTCLEKIIGDYARSYDYGRALPAVPEGMGGKVWTCWWQGLGQAPEVVRACVGSLRRNSAGREVVVVTEENAGDYVDLPGWMLDRVRAGSVSRTNLSDLLRLSLLASYGGVWLDATFFCARPLDDPVYSAPLFSIKRPGYLHGSIAGGMFAGYSLGCDEGHRFVFSAARDLFLEYWRRTDYLVDYLLVDYVIAEAQRASGAVSDAFSRIGPNNPRCDDLLKVLGDPYDDGAWRGLREGTDLFKLTWKRRFPSERGGAPTFYGKLVEGGLA